MVPRTGRPPKPDPRTHVVPVRFNDTEDAELKAAATEVGSKPGEFIRDAALAAARKLNRAAKRSR